MPLIVLNGAKLIYHKREFCQMYYSSCSRKRYQLGQSCSKICFKIAPTYPVSICLCCGYVFTNVVSLYFLLLFLCLWVRRLHNSGLYIMCVIASEHQILELLAQYKSALLRRYFRAWKQGNQPDLSAPASAHCYVCQYDLYDDKCTDFRAPRQIYKAVFPTSGLAPIWMELFCYCKYFWRPQ